jgi:hypothetical protein
VLDLHVGNLDICLIILFQALANLPQVADKLYHIMLYRVRLTMSEIQTTTLVMIGTDCIGSCKSNYQEPYDHDHDGPDCVVYYVQ